MLVLTVVGGAGWVVYRTPVLGLERVEVTAGPGGVSGDVQAAVVVAADVPTGTPLVSIDLAAVRHRILAVPQVATASVSRHWPNDLVVTVTQRTPIAVTSANGALWLLDTTGYPYLRVTRDQVPAGLLTIALATPGPRDAATLAALAVIAEVRPPVKATVASVVARSPYSVVLNLLDGRAVIWGSPDQGAKKMEILPAVLAQPGRTYDISVPDYVTVSAK